MLKTMEQAPLDATFHSVVGGLAEDYKFGEHLADELNNWQKLAGATNDIVTPANMIDAVAFGVGVYGIRNLDSWKGIGFACSGFMADFVDGKVARATGTQSELGEAIDAGGDKVKLAYALYKLWELDLAPKPLLIAVGLQNGINVALTAVDRSANKPPVLHPSGLGKKAIFIEQWGLGLHVIGTEVAKKNEKRGKALRTAGTVLTTAGVVIGAAATSGYVATLRNAKRASK